MKRTQSHQAIALLLVGLMAGRAAAQDAPAEDTAPALVVTPVEGSIPAPEAAPIEDSSPAPEAVPVEDITPAPAVISAPAEAANPSQPAAVEPGVASPAEEEEEIEEVDEVEVAPTNPFVATDAWTGPGYAVIERGFNVLLPSTAPRNSLQLSIDHRTYQSLVVSPADSLLGYTAGSLKVMLGLRYSVLDGLDLGVQVANGTVEPWRTNELDVRWQLLRRDQHFVDAMIRAGATWFALPNADDASGFFGQAMVGGLLLQRLYLAAGVLAHSSSSNEYKLSTDTGWTVAVPLVAELRLVGPVALTAEVTIPALGYSARDIPAVIPDLVGTWAPVFSIGPKVITSRHTFALVLSNSQQMTSDAFITGAVAAKPFGAGAGPVPNLVLGFTITRTMGFGDL